MRKKMITIDMMESILRRDSTYPYTLYGIRIKRKAMNGILTAIMCLMISNCVWAVNKYSVNDILYVIDENIHLLSEQDTNSKSMAILNKGSIVRTLEAKYDKSCDAKLTDDDTQWQSALTGRWTKVKYGKFEGYIFDVYLSHYNFKELVNSQQCISNDTISVQDFEVYTRTIHLNGVIYENGLGMEWGKEVFLIPDFTFEEAILFIKPTMIDYSFGEPKWLITNNKIKLDESDSISIRSLEIIKHGEYIIIEITDGN